MSAPAQPTPAEQARDAVDDARFPLVAAGYDPRSVDELLDHLAALLAQGPVAAPPEPLPEREPDPAPEHAADGSSPTIEVAPATAVGAAPEPAAPVHHPIRPDPVRPVDAGRAEAPTGATAQPTSTVPQGRRRLTDDDLAFLASLRASVGRGGDDGDASAVDPPR